MTDAPKLAPCPFCGGEAKFTYFNGGWPDHCFNVECADWKCPSRSGGRASKKAAAELWNTRTPSPTYAAGWEAGRRAAAERAQQVADVGVDADTPEYEDGFDSGACTCASAILALTAPVGEGWRPIETAPRDGTKFDAWCVTPGGSNGVRIPDVQMRGDGSGFGFIAHLPNGVSWQYLDARQRDEQIFPAWEPTHWMPLPPAPQEGE